MDTKYEKANKHDTRADSRHHEAEAESRFPSRKWKPIVAFVKQKDFLGLMIIPLSTLLTRAYPPLRAMYLAPETSTTWIAVCSSFFIAGIGVERRRHHRIPVLWCFFCISRLLSHLDLIERKLGDGMTIVVCLQLTINMLLILTKSSGESEAAVIFNSVLIGVLLTQFLILGYLHAAGCIDEAFEVGCEGRSLLVKK